jgi:hypothetical protein
VSLTGTGTDFSLSADPTSRSVTAGQSAAYTLSVNPISGFNQAVSLSCTVAPVGPTCSFSSNSVTPDGTNPASVTVTVTTTARAMAPVPRTPIPPFGDVPPQVVVLWLLGLALMAARFNRRRSDPSNSHAHISAARTALAATMLLVLLWAACGGGGTRVQPPDGDGTRAGDYTLTVTGTSSGVERTTTLSLTVS